jgi:peptidoglycan/LPS O-acetylase OafA/YrhL
MWSREKISQRSVNQDYFPALTGIRAVASLLVYIGHFNPFSGPAFGKWVPAIIHEFHVGVTMFFVLSGFLIFYRYGDSFGRKGHSLRNYFINRFARIYPMYFILTVWTFLPFVCLCLFRMPVFLLNITFLRSFFTEYLSTGDPSGWSLTPEEMFYALVPLMVLVSKKVPYLLQATLFLSLGVLLTAIFSHISFHGFFGSFQLLFEYTFFGRCFEFYTGMLLAMYVKKKAAVHFPPGRPFCTSAGIAWIILCVSGLAVNTHMHFRSQPGFFLLIETLINNFLLPPGIALLYYGLITERSLLQRLLGTALFLALGKSSYVFYLIHVPFFAYLYFNFGEHPIPVFLLMELIAWLMYISMEKPLNHLIRRKLARPVHAPSFG